MRIPFDVPKRGDRPFDVVGLGLNSIDLMAVVAEYPEPNSKQPLQRFARLPGGETATAMAVCARLGWDASYIGSFGDDEFGRISAESLRAAGVSIGHTRVVAGAVNQFAMILVDARSGDRTVLWDRDPKLTLTPEEVKRDASTEGRLLVLDSVQTAAATQAATYARGAGIPTILDIDKVRPGTQELLRQIDVIIGAESLPSELTGYDEPGRALAAMASEYGSAIACVTLGDKGCLARVNGIEILVPAFSVPCVDTTGAGDAFRAGFAAGCLEMPKGEVKEVLAYANAVAALNCRGLGARGGMPTRSEVEALLVR